jgi:hypothetical protein
LTPQERLRAFARAYRAWALAEPHRYRLLFTAPLPGYDAQSARLVTASQEAMNVLLDVLAELVPETAHGEPNTLDGQLDRWARDREVIDARPALALRAVITWTRLHGMVSLEIEGNFASMGIDPELLYETEVTSILDAHPA